MGWEKESKVARKKKRSLLSGEWAVLITAGKIIGIFVLAWVISFFLSAIIWVFAYYFSPLVGADKESSAVLERYFSLQNLSTNYGLVDWRGAKYGDMEVVLEDKKRKQVFVVYVLREMPIESREVIFSSKPGGEEYRKIIVKRRYLSGVYHREIGAFSYDFFVSHYKKYLLSDFLKEGTIIQDTQGSREGGRYRLLRGHLKQIIFASELGQSRFKMVLRWSYQDRKKEKALEEYKQLKKALDERDIRLPEPDLSSFFPSIGIVFIERREEPQKLYVVTMELGEKEENLPVVQDFIKSYFGMEM